VQGRRREQVVSTSDVALGPVTELRPPIDERSLELWQGRIAKAARNGGGLDDFRAALQAMRQAASDRVHLEYLKNEILGAADRHLIPVHGLHVIEAIYLEVFPEVDQADDAFKCNDELDSLALTIDESTATDAEIMRLSQLSFLAYERERKRAATRLGIARVSVLDNAVNARRAAQEAVPPLFPWWQVEPWPERVDGNDLVTEIMRHIQSHVVLSNEAVLAVTLWVLMAWAHDQAAVHSPILLITSAEANSGKSTLLGVISFLVPRSLPCVEISEATLYRSISLWSPTILVDEADVLLVQNEPLRSGLNSGWTRGSGVPRCTGEDHVPRLFKTFCPKVIGMKGKKLPDTTLSRAIIIEVKRKLPSQNAQHFAHTDDEVLAGLRRKALRWVNDNMASLRQATPEMPPTFENRLGDNWRLLFSIAEEVGGEWPEKARAAAKQLSAASDANSHGTDLLADIRALFGETEADRLSGEQIVGHLATLEGRSWPEWRGGKPMTKAALARLLSKYGIQSGTIRLRDSSTAKGYYRSSFDDAFLRYLPIETVTPSQAANDGHCDALESVTRENDVTVSKTSQPNNDGLCDGVTVDTEVEEIEWTL
jgi:putative DNA primase/helicase